MKTSFKYFFLMLMASAQPVYAMNDQACLDQFLVGSSQDLNTEEIAKLLTVIAGADVCSEVFARLLIGHPELVTQLAEFREGTSQIYLGFRAIGVNGLTGEVAQYLYEQRRIDQIGVYLYHHAEQITDDTLTRMIHVYIDGTPTYCSVVLSKFIESNKNRLLDNALRERELNDLPICGYASMGDLLSVD